MAVVWAGKTYTYSLWWRRLVWLQDSICPSALSPYQSEGPVHKWVTHTGTKWKDEMKESYCNVKLWTFDYSSSLRRMWVLKRVKYTWGNLLLGSTWLSIARTKAAVFPVPDCDWAIRFCGLKDKYWNYKHDNDTLTILTVKKFEQALWLRYIYNLWNTHGSASIMGKAVSWILEGRLKPMPYTPWSSWGLLQPKKSQIIVSFYFYYSIKKSFQF